MSFTYKKTYSFVTNFEKYYADKMKKNEEIKIEKKREELINVNYFYNI